MQLGTVGVVFTLRKIALLLERRLEPALQADAMMQLFNGLPREARLDRACAVLVRLRARVLDLRTRTWRGAGSCYIACALARRSPALRALP